MRLPECFSQDKGNCGSDLLIRELVVGEEPKEEPWLERA